MVAFTYGTVLYENVFSRKSGLKPNTHSLVRIDGKQCLNH